MDGTMRRVAVVVGGVLTGVFLLALAGSAQAMQMDRTRPDHLRPPFSAPEPPAVIPPRTVFPHSGRAVYALPKGLDGMAQRDNELSRLCQRGAFLQNLDGHFWAVAPDRRYGVAFPSGGSLDDPQKKAQPGKVYFFTGQDSRCTVYVGDREKLMPHYLKGG